MNNRKWSRGVTLFSFIGTVTIGLFNYIIDPYGLYKTNFFHFISIKKSNKMRLIKALKIREIKPTSVCLGTSRAEFGYDPDHNYFIKPSYNLANSDSSMYEEYVYFKYALEQGKLKKVLLVADYIMFNSLSQRHTNDFENYFKNKNIYTYLLSIDTFKDSLLT